MLRRREDVPGGYAMRERIYSPVDPLLLGGAAFALFGSLFAFHKLGIMDLRIFWHCWMLLLVIVG
jgi:hypothetical protein